MSGMSLSNLSMGMAGPTKGVGVRDPLAAWIGASTWADYSAKALDRMFQLSTGQTAVTASADKVGLWLDGAQLGGLTLSAYLAAQPELLSNSASGWLPGLGGSVADDVGKLKITGAVASGTGGSCPITCVVGTFYKISFNIEMGTATQIDAQITASQNGGGAIDGTYRLVSSNSTQYMFFLATATTMYLQVCPRGAGIYCYGSAFTAKKIAGYHGRNSTAAQRLNLLIASTRYTLTADGTDDNHLTNWLAASGGNTKIIAATAPATLAGIQTISGANASGTDRWRLSIDTSGHLCAGVGSQSETTIVGTRDVRSKDFVAALTHDGANVGLFLYMDGVASTEYAAAQAGSLPTTTPLRLAATNNAGTAAQLFAGGIARDIEVLKGGLTAGDFQNIAPQIFAAAA